MATTVVPGTTGDSGATQVLPPPPAAAASGPTWVAPDLTTYTELAGASYDHGASSFSANGGTLGTSDTHGAPDLGLDAGGIVSADLGLTLSDYAAVIIEFDCDSIPTASGQGTVGIYAALLNTNSLESGKGLYAGVVRLAGGAYRLEAGVVGTTPSTSAQFNEVFGRVRITIPLSDTGIPTGIGIGGEQAGRPAEFVSSHASTEPVAFDTGVRLAILADIETSHATGSDRAPVFSDFQYSFIEKPAA
jgi:hypothetical protein